jgi:uncharacterized protein (TIGR02145 family)
MKTPNKKWLCPLMVVGLVLILTNSCKKKEDTSAKITDKDGNDYTSVTIGAQVWMVENLKTTKYSNGDQIPNLSSDQWYSTTSGTYKTNSTTYGNLYNGYAVDDSRKLCPTGWHVPSKADWDALIAYLGGENIAGGKMKESGTTHWLSPNNGATNESGFTGLPAGSTAGADIDGMGLGTFLWSSTETDDYTSNYAFELSYVAEYCINMAHLKFVGYSVRCIKD